MALSAIRAELRQRPVPVTKSRNLSPWTRRPTVHHATTPPRNADLAEPGIKSPNEPLTYSIGSSAVETNGPSETRSLHPFPGRSMASSFKMSRVVEFCETDMAGIVHFSNFYIWMEQAEHAFFSIARTHNRQPSIRWQHDRLAASFGSMSF